LWYWLRQDDPDAFRALQTKYKRQFLDIPRHYLEPIYARLGIAAPEVVDSTYTLRWQGICPCGPEDTVLTLKTLPHLLL
jgi:hypothetical protein